MSRLNWVLKIVLILHIRRSDTYFVVSLTYTENIKDRNNVTIPIRYVDVPKDGITFSKISYVKYQKTENSKIV